ncbi:MAG: cytidine deaminase [bacterium]|nr:cytidine deaminase [bacterium]
MTRAAAAARENAYAPYSDFSVGAAALARDGRVFTGCNVENVSYGLSTCAERNAIAAAVCQGGHDLTTIAVVTSASPPASPCGACRQVMAEFGIERVILANLAGERFDLQMHDLLPAAFDRTSLETD